MLPLQKDINEQSPLIKKTCCSLKKTCCESALPPSRDNEVCQLSEEPWKHKCVALICALFLAVGSHFAAHTLGALKSIIKREYDISNSQYGVIQSSVSIVNTILPLLGGLFIDAFGTIPGSILTTILITLGNVLVALSSSTTNVHMMIMGRILYGIGGGTVVIVQETILSQWFSGRSLAVVIALMMTVSRLSSFLAQATVVPIANWLGWYGYGLWFSALLCVFSLVINLVYIVLLKSVTSKNSLRYCRVQKNVKHKKMFRWSQLTHLPHSYWLISLMEFLLGGAWSCFLHINSELIKFKFDYNDQQAAAVASIGQVIPIFVMPILGILIDRYGKRTWMMFASGLSFLVCILLLEYTNLHPILGMISFSTSLALGPIALVSSVPVILPFSLVGTGMGLVKSCTNIGTSLFDIMTGWVQDLHQNKEYTGVMIFFIVVIILSILASAVLYVLDLTIYGGILDQSHSSLQHSKFEDDFTTTTKSKANYVYGGIFLLLVATCWILFFKFVLF
ncbi:major facilitator superfamily domain-containing protein [Pilobolus umbonatus]|nr:major facilitator superfamily domain-containing protein [Pilobolus umbonatus]